jgi:hypothetical protein
MDIETLKRAQKLLDRGLRLGEVAAKLPVREEKRGVLILSEEGRELLEKLAGDIEELKKRVSKLEG